jgi:outer membrane protein
MRTIRIFSAALLAGMLAAGGSFAQSETASSDVAGHFQVRLRGLAVLPDAGGTVTVAGKPFAGSFSISNSFVPEVDGTYFITNHVALEAIAATTQHSPHFSSVGDLGSVWLLPPTVTAQYHFDPNGSFRPYVGAGVNYTLFYSPRSGAVPGMKYEDAFGWALQAGADIPVGDGPYFLNVDAKKLFLNTDVKAAGGVVRAHADINPWIVGAGIGVRF